MNIIFQTRRRKAREGREGILHKECRKPGRDVILSVSEGSRYSGKSRNILFHCQDAKGRVERLHNVISQALTPFSFLTPFSPFSFSPFSMCSQDPKKRDPKSDFRGIIETGSKKSRRAKVFFLFEFFSFTRFRQLFNVFRF